MKNGIFRYTGGEACVYIVFDNGDETRVLPLLDRLALEGIRFWYPCGETGAEASGRLAGSRICLVLLSEKAVSRHNVLNKIVFSALEGKKLCFVKLEACSGTPALNLLVKGNPCFTADSEEFYPLLLKELEICRAANVSPTPQEMEEWRRRWESGNLEKEPEPHVLPEPESAAEEPKPSQAAVSLIAREATGECYALTKETLEIGRKTKEYLPDIAVDDPDKAISRHHAILSQRDGKWYLSDDNSANGTFIGPEKKQIQGKAAAELQNGMCFYLNREGFVFYSGEDALAVSAMSRDAVREKLKPAFIPAPPAQADALPSAAAEKQPGDQDRVQAGRLQPEEPKIEEMDDPVDSMTIMIPLNRQSWSEVEQMLNRQNTAAAQAVESADEEKPEKDIPAAIIRLRTGEFRFLHGQENVIGRKGKRRRADIALEGNESMSREHASIMQCEGRFLLRDCGSLAGTFIGEDRIGEDQPAEILDQTVFLMAGEEFLFVTGDTMNSLCRMKKLCSLENTVSGEKKWILTKPLMLDRVHPWEDGLLKTPYVSRKQTVVYWEKEQIWVMDRGSSNGTFLDGVKLGSEPAALHGGSRLTIAEAPNAVEFQYAEISLSFEEEANES